MSISVEIKQLSSHLEQSLEKLKKASPRLVKKFESIIKLANNHIKATPNTDWITHIHVVGESRAMKSSYILDLYNNPELRQYLQIPTDSENDHTACPCMIIPTNTVSQIKVGKTLISEFSELEDIESYEEFQKYYSLNEQEKLNHTGGYLLKVYLPIDQCDFKHTVIEYPGIDSNEFATVENKDFYERIAKESLACFEALPGVVVACFKKLTIPPNHPLVVFINNYRRSLERGHGELPLTLSFNGDDAIRKNCSGNTKLVKILDEKFSIHKKFNLKVQLINPNYNDEKYRVKCPENIEEKKVKEWIDKFSNYGSYENLRQHIADNGGIKYSRELLSGYAENKELSNDIGYFYHADWIEDGKAHLDKLDKAILAIKSWDDADNISQYIKDMLRQYDANSYQSIIEIFNDNKSEMPQSGKQNGHMEYNQLFKDYWKSLIFTYYEQFIPKADNPICENRETAKRLLKNNVIEELFNNILYIYLDDNEWPASTSFKNGHAEKTLANILEFYLPNQLLSGNKKLLIAMSGREYR